MKKILFLSFLMGSGVYHGVSAQGWVMDGYFAMQRVGTCTLIKTNSVNFNFAGVSGSGTYVEGAWDWDWNTIQITLTGTGTPSGSLSFNGYGKCYDTYDEMDPTYQYLSGSYTYPGTYTPPGCVLEQYSSYVAQSTDGYIGGSWVFHPRMIITPPTQVCDVVNISSPTCVAAPYGYTWEVRDSPSGAWYTINGKNTASISMTPTEFSNIGLSRYGRKDFRVTGRTGTTSLIETVDVYYSGPGTSFETTDPICHNDKNGSIKVNITSADASVIDDFLIRIYDPNVSATVAVGQYNVTNGFSYTITTLDNGSGLGAGAYSISVTNNTNIGLFGSCLTNANTSLTNPSQVAVSSLDTTKYNGYAVKCYGGSDAQITAIGSGGAGGYTYVWSPGGATSQTISGLSAGSYSVELKDSKSCAATKGITIHQPQKLNAPILSTAKMANGGFDVSCWNKTDGAIQVAPSGGAGVYSYLWSSGQTSATIPAIGIGSYAVEITDGNLCTAQGSITLTAPLPIDFSIDQITPLVCSGDATSLTAVNVTNVIPSGTATYTWSTGEITPGISNKAAGNYALTISDGQGCSATRSKIIINPPAHTVEIKELSDFNGKPISCPGEDDGVLFAEVKDHNNVVVTAEKYVWTKNLSSTVGQGPSATSVNNLEQGNYKVVITYNTNCEAEDSHFLAEPDAINVSIAPTTNYHGQIISCFGMSDANLKASAVGGTLTSIPYEFTWDTGVTGSLLSGVGAGEYQVEVKDANGCKGDKIFTLENPLPVEAWVINVSSHAGFGVSCVGQNDGSITAGGQGGTGVYSYSWSNGILTAANPSLTAGMYTVTVSDNNGCHDAIDQEITSPPLLELDLGPFNNIACFGGSNGSISLQAKGGVVNTYEFSKDNGSTWQPSSTFNGLSVGNYTLIAKDINNCTQTVSRVLTQPDEIEITFSNVHPALCSTPVGTATADVTGGVTAYTYEWRDSQNNTVGSNAPTLPNAKGDLYTVVVHDSHLCEATNFVAITSLDGAQSNYTEVPAKCFDSSDGSALVNIIAGDGPFDIRWPDGQTALQAVNLKRGAYNVLITDVRNCTVIQTVNVTSPDALQLQQQNKIIPTCNGACDGELELVASGGVGGYAYSWNGQAVSHQAQLCAGIYPVVLKDGNQCILNQTITLKQPDPVDVVVLNESLPTCRDGCNGALEVVATGGNGGFDYTWAAGGNTTRKNNLCPGSYAVSVVDSKGCSIQKNVVLTNTPRIPLDLGGGVTVCVGQSYSLDAGSNWSGIKWKSNTGFASEEQRVTLKEPGSYWLETVNDQGCIAQDTFLLETSTDLLKASFMIPKEAIVGDTVVIIDVSWPLPESIEWSYPSSMEKVGDLGDIVFGRFYAAGTYTIGLTAHLGECLGSVSKTITIVEEQEENEGGRLGHEEYVKTFTLHPNPNNGAFEVGVELIEEGAVTLSIWSGTRGALLYQVNRQDKQFYKVGVDLRPLAAGVYVVRLDHARGTKYLRFVVE